MGTFTERITQLINDVGTGKLEGRVVVDQPYAQDQHETLGYTHQGGGKARYLGDPLFQNVSRYMELLAGVTLHGGLEEAMVQNMEHLSRQVFDQAPFEFGDLRASGHPIVKSGGTIVYDRPPNARRLNAGSLQAKQDLRNLGLGHNSWVNHPGSWGDDGEV